MYAIFSWTFFSKLNWKHITNKDKADKSVISIELVKTEEDKSSCPLQMDKRFLRPICHSFLCSQTSIILILITILLARIHPPTTTLRLLPNSCSYLRVPPPSQACQYFRNVMGHSFYQGGPGRSELQLMFRLMTLDFRGRIHLSLTTQSTSQVSQVHILHISSNLVSLYHQGTERGRTRHLDASLSPLSVKGASATTSGHQNFVELLLSKMNPNLYYLYTFSRSLYEYVEWLPVY